MRTLFDRGLLMALSFFLFCSQDETTGMITSARITAINMIDIRLSGEKSNPRKEEFTLTPPVRTLRLENRDGFWRLTTDPLDLSRTHFLNWRGQRCELYPDGVLDTFYSHKELGCSWDQESTTFRLFAPRASRVSLWLFASMEDTSGREHPMKRDSDGVWEATLPGQYFGRFYNYRVEGPDGPTEDFDGSLFICDPYSHAVATRNEYQHRGRTLIIDDRRFDWRGDVPLGYRLEDLIIYECHVRDLTAHASSGAADDVAGSYKALTQSGLQGGLDHIKSLGVNAIELLPVHEFGNIEIPYRVKVGGVINTWNPYARNHWGYMSSYFLAPESYYASGQTMQPGGLCGIDGRQIDELKEVVRTFHREGIAVILDVVYNHVSQYDQNCFKLADKKYYFRLDDEQQYLAASGCGNDFKTERPMAQRLILDSILFWMREYHVDGFRFDLASMIDWQTVDLITREARKINPEVILIAEPWGGGKYSPAEFSRHGWAAWNDQFRNGIKGQNPVDGQSFIFGRWWGGNNLDKVKNYICGTLAADGGLFLKPQHAVNYLGSHDDHCFGDFVRIGSGETGADARIRDAKKNAKLTPRQMKISKLGALILFTSQGAVMIEEGHEFARSKLIAASAAPDSNAGRIDHNSYNKDNETNWLDYNLAALNGDLTEYYRGLIALRRKYSAFRHTAREHIQFLESPNDFALSFLIDRTHNAENVDLLVLVNAHAEAPAAFDLPPGSWRVLADGEQAGVVPRGLYLEKKILLPAATGMILVR